MRGKTEGKALLVDGKEDTLYKFHKDQLTEEKYVLLNYEEARKMDAFRIVFDANSVYMPCRCVLLEYRKDGFYNG